MSFLVELWLCLFLSSHYGLIPIDPTIIDFIGGNLSQTTKTYRTQSANWRDYLRLCKPKVVLLLLITALVGMLLTSPKSSDIALMAIATLGIGLVASAAAVVNHLVDVNIDGKMARTRSRPLVSGRLSSAQAAVFSLLMALSGLWLLTVYVNPLTAILTLAGLFGYAVIYTIYLKHSTPQNIVWGGLAGALPPLLGWTSMTNNIASEGIILMLIIFFWTPAHFWPLAIDRIDDYKKANVPMLPVIHGIEYTKNSIIAYTLILNLVSWLPYLTGMSGLSYLIAAIVLGCWFLYFTLQLKFKPEKKTAITTFYVSIVYLFLLFLALVIDHSISQILQRLADV